MRKFTSASALAAMALSCALAVSPAASAGHAPVLRSLSHLQPGGPIAVAGGGQQLRGSDLYSTQNVVSDNWGGYAALRSGTKFRFIRATFFVPYVNCANTPSSFSGHWVGLDGLGNSTVEQDGLLAACNGGVPEYAVWYEMFPDPRVYQNVAVAPGDSTVATVDYSARSKKFTLSVADTTNGQHFTVTKPCPGGSTCPRTSVEAISEAPSNGSSILPLTDFGAESYSSVKVTDRAGEHGGLRSSHWDTLSITTGNSNGDVLDQPTQIFRGVAFEMYWMRMN